LQRDFSTSKQYTGNQGVERMEFKMESERILQPMVGIPSARWNWRWPSCEIECGSVFTRNWRG